MVRTTGKQNIIGVSETSGPLQTVSSLLMSY